MEAQVEGDLACSRLLDVVDHQGPELFGLRTRESADVQHSPCSTTRDPYAEAVLCMVAAGSAACWKTLLSGLTLARFSEGMVMVTMRVTG